MPRERCAAGLSAKFRQRPPARPLTRLACLRTRGVWSDGLSAGLLAAPRLILREEFSELAKSGFTPLGILQTTTCDAADYVGRADTMGAVEPGMNADLVLLSANPVERVENLHAIVAVVRNGRRYDKSELDELKAQVARHRGRLN